MERGGDPCGRPAGGLLLPPPVASPSWARGAACGRPAGGPLLLLPLILASHCGWRSLGHPSSLFAAETGWACPIFPTTGDHKHPHPYAASYPRLIVNVHNTRLCLSLPQPAPHRLPNSPDNPVAYINHLGVRQRPIEALKGELVGQRLMAGRDRMTAVNVEEFHLAQQGATTLANDIE